VSWQLDRQSNAVESVRSVLRRIAAIGIDAGFLSGSGASGAPFGLLNTTGVNSQSGTALAWSGICTMEEAVALKDASDANLAWVAHPTVRKLLRQRERITGGGRAIWEGNTVAGHPAFVSTCMPSASLALGDFSNATILLWGGVEVLINPYSTTGFQQGVIELAVFVAMDVAVNYPAAFAKSTSIT
jgi:HK97 family phage major capsid protein